MSLDSFIESKNIRLDQHLRFTAEIRSLWEEFDAMQTPDAKYAACMDRLQPFLHNTLTDGHTWVESGMARQSVEKRMAIIRDFMPEVYKWVEKNLDNAVAKKWLVS